MTDKKKNPKKHNLKIIVKINFPRIDRKLSRKQRIQHRKCKMQQKTKMSHMNIYKGKNKVMKRKISPHEKRAAQNYKP